ncbi:hypothetical protein AVEN_7006-1, partial [Araneus ventricosus]
MFGSKNDKIALLFGLHDRPLKLPQGALRLPLFLRSLRHWIVVVTFIRKLRVSSEWPSPATAQSLPQEVFSVIGVE